MEDVLKIKDALLGHFLEYVKISSGSSSREAQNGVMPSTPGQKEMARILCGQLKSLGLENVQTTENCYTYGILPANGSDEKPLCLLAHIDTSEEVSGENVRPLVHENYSGGKIILSDGIELDPESDPCLALAGKNGETVITGDGTTLLGADDKAGVAEIISCLEFLVSHPELEHPAVEVIFSPDEETGHGMDKVPLNLLKSQRAYTVDGGHIGELETECFNAFQSEIRFLGNASHTGTARAVMVNALTMACSFVANLPVGERPETTDGRQGFFAPVSVEGSIGEASVSLLLRDFSTEGMERRKNVVDLLAKTTAELFGGKTEVRHVQQYLNMKNVLDKNPQIVERLVEAYKKSGVQPVFSPIRGGTDGSRLTEMGIPCPNIFTGGHNFHSRREWASLNQMVKAAEILVRLCCKNFPN
ncbi:peptidase T [Treponema sp.]|uniref:peptidase T n=1 Tax=Treponema sp. TaxID=166 RepID=UPI003F042C0D